MPSDSTYKRRVKLPRKAHTKDRAVSDATSGNSKGRVRFANNMRNTKYRSAFEINVARSLADRGVSFEYEQKKLPYVPKPRVYTPDFHLLEADIFVEAKGYMDKGDRVKMILVKKQYPDLDIRFLFLNAKNKIYKGSKTTYAAWADKHGFIWAEKYIPEEWLKNDR